MLAEEEQLIRAAARLFRESRHAVTFTGAGVSTASGIPDFRSRGTGLWEHADPMAVASLEGFRTRPDTFYAWIRPLAQQMFAAADLPAMAHRNGAALIIINREETHLDNTGNVVLRADVSEALPAIVARLPTVGAVRTREFEVT